MKEEWNVLHMVDRKMRIGERNGLEKRRGSGMRLVTGGGEVEMEKMMH